MDCVLLVHIRQPIHRGTGQICAQKPECIANSGSLDDAQETRRGNCKS